MKGTAWLFYKELVRFSKVAFQTVLAPVVTALLYLLVFAHVLEGRVRVFEGISYTVFLVPGLIMMSLIQNAFANSSSSLIQSKVTGNIVFVLITPLSPIEFYAAYVGAAIVRAVVVGMGVFLAAAAFTELPIHSLLTIVCFALLSSAVLGTLGLIAGVWADKIDQLAAVQNFVVMPLSFLSGVFYSIQSLPPFWQDVSRFNPFFYMIDGFRHGFFGVSDVPVLRSLSITAVVFAGLSAAAVWMLHRGYKLRQ